MKITVRPRDSLSAILKRYNVPGWNTPAVWNKLAPQLRSKNPNRIYAGEVIDLSPVLPQSQKSTPAPATPAPTAPAPAAPAPAAPASAGATAGQSAAPKRVANFATEVMPFEQFWDPNLARSAIAQRTASYFDPQAQRAREGIESDFASRGLTRSSQRGKGVMDMIRDMAEKEQTMREQLYGGIQGQAKEDWGFQQKLYEDRPDEYQKTTFDKSNYEYQFPEESPQKYAQSYRQWLRSTYNI